MSLFNYPGTWLLGFSMTGEGKTGSPKITEENSPFGPVSESLPRPD
jgi:hypothetical protein